MTKPSELPKRKLKKNMKVFVLGCSHAPLTPEATWDWMLGKLEDYQPDVIVHTGDWQEASTCSRHPTDDGYSLLDEYEFIANQSDQIRRVAPNARLIRHEGNHEYRFDPENINTTHNRRLRHALHWTQHPLLASEWGHWLTVPYRNGAEGCFRLGQLLTYHGHKLGGTGDEIEALNRITSTQSPLGTLAVRSHTHKPKPPTQCRKNVQAPLPFWYANVGTLGPLSPAYAHGFDTSEWGAALLQVDLRLEDSYNTKSWDFEYHTF